MALLSIFAGWGVPFAFLLAATAYSLSCIGWSLTRLDRWTASSPHSHAYALLEVVWW